MLVDSWEKYHFSLYCSLKLIFGNLKIEKLKLHFKSCPKNMSITWIPFVIVLTINLFLNYLAQWKLWQLRKLEHFYSSTTMSFWMTKYRKTFENSREIWSGKTRGAIIRGRGTCVRFQSFKLTYLHVLLSGYICKAVYVHVPWYMHSP